MKRWNRLFKLQMQADREMGLCGVPKVGEERKAGRKKTGGDAKKHNTIDRHLFVSSSTRLGLAVRCGWDSRAPASVGMRPGPIGPHICPIFAIASRRGFDIVGVLHFGGQTPEGGNGLFICLRVGASGHNNIEQQSRVPRDALANRSFNKGKS